MTAHRFISIALLLLLVPVTYAATTITAKDEAVEGDIPRPGQIWVYDFYATASDIPPGSALSGQMSDAESAQTAEQISAGRKLGAEIGTELIKQLQAMGLKAGRASAGTQPQINDVVLQGYLVSEDEGNEKKRLMIGFGTGESELKAVVRGFANTASGLQELGSAKTDSTAGLVGKTPGMAVGALGTIATHNPLGLIVSTGVKNHEEKSGGGKLDGRAIDTARKIAEMLQPRFEKFGWIEASGT